MDWLSWLEKGKKVQLTIAGWNEEDVNKKKLQKEIDNEKREDPMLYDHKTASWESWLEKNDPCWEGYEQYGMKDKDGKKVPNCVKKADESKPLNKPMRDDGSKKFKVFVRDPSTGNIVTVRFGDPNMEIKRDNPERRSSFRARHKCSEQKDITSAAYWSCKMWEKTSSVSDNVNKSNWESWLEKNNAIETSHKDEKEKEEWDGKFSSSTIEDEVKDDKDDKAVSEEEPLDELTEGKLEEIEKLKSWEAWLEKGLPGAKKVPLTHRDPDPEETNVDKIIANAELAGKTIQQKKSNEQREEQFNKDWAMTEDEFELTYESNDKMKKIPKPKVRAPYDKTGDKSPLKSGEYSTENGEKWKSWLEKMQGAGDARFGNQHLTGLDQKPVDNEEDEANILPEKDVNTDEKDEKQEETEDKDDKDNKPYKALSHE